VGAGVGCGVLPIPINPESGNFGWTKSLKVLSNKVFGFIQPEFGIS
jgi:hypothetical protein